MNIPAKIAPAEKLCLPMTAMFSVVEHPDRTVAHALDFDLVAVAPTSEEAVRKIRLAVKHHVEFGLKNGFEYDILFKAPQSAWDALTPDAKLSIGEPILIDKYRLITVTRTATENEYQPSSIAA